MAAKFATSINRSSDLIYDFACSSCKENDLNIEAQVFCGECSKFFCGQCVEHHSRLFNKHVVLGRKDVDKWLGQGDTLARCNLHPEEIIKMECQDHNQLCCHTCVDLDHRTCKRIMQVEELARGIHNMAQFKQLPAGVSKLTIRLKQVIHDSKENQNSLNLSGNSMLTQIKDLRDTLNQLLDQLEKGTKEEMNNVLRDLDGSLQRDIESCTHMHDQLKALMDKIQDSGEDNEPNSYIGHRKCIEKMREVDKLLHEMLPKLGMKVSFQADTLASEVLSQLKTLGTIQKVQSVQSILRAIQIDKHNIKRKTDESDCGIQGIAELPSEEILLVDITNSKVKMLNKKYKMTTHIDLPENPHDICHISDKELAVSVNSPVNSPDKRHEVHFLTVKASKIKMTRKFSVDHYCYSIRHHQDQLYVASATALYLYTTSGKLVEKIYEDTSSGCTVKRFALAGDGRKIYIAASDHHKLITIDNKGTILSTLQDPDIMSPVGVYVNEEGHVFVCSYRSCTVVQVDQEGRRKLATLVKEEDGMNYPQAVCYGTRMRRLIVGGEQNHILVVHLQ